MCITALVYCHNDPNPTAQEGYHRTQEGYHRVQEGYHRVSRATKNTNITKTAEDCINCISACLIPPSQIPWKQDPKHIFASKSRKTKIFVIFDPSYGGGGGGGACFNPTNQPEPPPKAPPQNCKIHWGTILSPQTMIFTGG